MKLNKKLFLLLVLLFPIFSEGQNIKIKNTFSFTIPDEWILGDITSYAYPCNCYIETFSFKHPNKKFSSFTVTYRMHAEPITFTLKQYTQEFVERNLLPIILTSSMKPRFKSLKESEAHVIASKEGLPDLHFLLRFAISNNITLVIDYCAPDEQETTEFLRSVDILILPSS